MTRFAHDLPAILVPTEHHVEAALASRPAWSARTIRAFVEDAAARLAPEIGLVSPHATRLLAREALGEAREGRLQHPEEPAAEVELAHAIDRAIGRLRRAGTRPAHLRAVGSPHALLLADVMERVDERLAAARLADARSAGTIAAERLAAGAPAEGLDELGCGEAVITGAAAFELDDLAVIEALHARLRARGGDGVRLELPRLEGAIGRAFDDATTPVADALERRWASLPDPPAIDWVDTRPAHPASILIARSADGEARAVTAAILAAIGRGTPPERIAVVVPALDEAALEPLRGGLADARVPFCEPRGRPAARSPEGRVVLGLLALAAGPVTREQVIELLRAPGLDAGVWSEQRGDPEAAHRAAALAHRLREIPVEIDRTGDLLLDALGEHVRREHPDEAWMLRVLENLLRTARWLGDGGPGIAADVRAAARSPGAASSRRDLARRLLALVDALGLGRTHTGELGAALRADARGAGALPLVAIGEGEAAVRAVRAAVGCLVDGAERVGLADRPSSVAELAAELALTAGELGTGLGVRAARAGAVRIARPGELAGLDHDLVVVTGLAESAYSGAPGDEALVDERVRRRLPMPCRPPSAREREAARLAELAWAMAGAERVMLSYATGDEGEATPHRLVRWAHAHGAREHKEPASRVSAGASRIDERSAELVALAAGAEPRPEIAERAAVERARAAFFLDPRAPSFEFAGRIALADDHARQRLVACVGGDAPSRTVAVTAIERAAGCAFAGFARRVLRVRRTEDLGESADARERGTLIHRALQAAFEAVRDASGRSDRGRLLAVAREAAERELGASIRMAPLRREAIAQAVGSALGVVARALDAGDPLRFRVGERRFGAHDEPPWHALELTGEDGAPVYVDGQIDRVDVSTDGTRARVVDYKTGKVPSGDEHGRSAFQLPLYAAVAARALGCEDVEVMYVSIRHRGAIEEKPAAEEERRALGARRAEIAGAARRIILGMWQGEVAPRPVAATLCARCEARDVCRRPAVAPFEEEDR